MRESLPVRLKISVIIPTIRIDEWLKDAVTSALNSASVDVELILVHDGVEPDYSKAWMSDNRIKIVHHTERMGVSAAVMSGVLAATSNLVARLDADDLMTENRLFLQSEYLRANNDCVAVGAAIQVIDEHGIKGSKLRFPSGVDIRKELFLQNVFPSSGSMFRKDIALKAGGFDPNMIQMEDYDFWLRIAKFGKLANLEEVLAFYRVHSQQMSRGAKPYGYQIKKISTDKIDLAKILKYPLLKAKLQHMIWRIAQFLRYYRLIRIGYKRKVI